MGSLEILLPVLLFLTEAMFLIEVVFRNDDKIVN